MLHTVTIVACCWLGLSIVSGIAFCWLIHRGIIGFAPIVDRNEFSRNWERRP